MTSKWNADKTVHVWASGGPQPSPLAWPAEMLAEAQDLGRLIGWEPTVEEAGRSLGEHGPRATVAINEAIEQAEADGLEGDDRLDFEWVLDTVPMAHDAQQALQWMPASVWSLAGIDGASPGGNIDTVEFPDLEVLCEALGAEGWKVVREPGHAGWIPGLNL